MERWSDTVLRLFLLKSPKRHRSDWNCRAWKNCKLDFRIIILKATHNIFQWSILCLLMPSCTVNTILLENHSLSQKQFFHLISRAPLSPICLSPYWPLLYVLWWLPSSCHWMWTCLRALSLDLFSHRLPRLISSFRALNCVKMNSIYVTGYSLAPSQDS